MNWLLKMAWRDSRRNRGRLLLFISSIVIGIAALVAINSFSENLQKDINREAKSLMGADLMLEDGNPVSDSLLSIFDTLEHERSVMTNFASMVLFPKTGQTRLALVRALEGNFPYYGKMVTEPAAAYRSFREGKKALVDKTMMIQFNVKPGDSVKVGNVVFEVEGQLNSSPGRAGIASSVAPVVFIPMQYLEQTGLVQMGSRVEYQYLYKYDEDFDVEAFARPYEQKFRENGVRLDTVEETREETGEAFSNMATFLNLVGFIALLLGCIGVASSVHIYIKDKLATVAVLRCLGASGKQGFYIYLIQIVAIGLFGAVLGAVGGSVLQLVLPKILGEFLPLQNISTDVSTWAIVQGVITGLAVSVLFALLPLLAIRKISPLRTLRASYEGDTAERDPLRWMVYGLIFLFVTGFTLVQTGFNWEALAFPVGIIIAFLLLAGVAKGLSWTVKRFFPTHWSYVWRQSIANLYRPNNQTLILIVSIGLGTFLISTLFFIQGLLLNQVEMVDTNNQPNMIMFDIQTPQKEGAADIVEKHGLPLMQKVPIVTMRLESIDGVTREQSIADSTSEVRRWVYNREYRNTYRDTLIDSETIVEGEWYGTKTEDGTIYISIADFIVDDLQAEIGTKLTFNVQGRLLETVVGSIRKVDFNRLQTNFMVVFPKGVLENAPQFHVIVSRVKSPEQSAAFQQELVSTYPNISVIDLTQILKTVDEVLGKISFVIQFMALFSILTGLLVLISSVVLSKYQRIQESVLLRTLGANRKQILQINAFEYLLLGALAALTGILLAIIASFLLAYFSFDIPWQPNLIPALIVFVAITVLTVIIGMLNSREVLSKPPLEVLRKEV